jgi:hypothetical protein
MYLVYVVMIDGAWIYGSVALRFNRPGRCLSTTLLKCLRFSNHRNDDSILIKTWHSFTAMQSLNNRMVGANVATRSCPFPKLPLHLFYFFIYGSDDEMWGELYSRDRSLSDRARYLSITTTLLCIIARIPNHRNHGSIFCFVSSNVAFFAGLLSCLILIASHVCGCGLQICLLLYHHACMCCPHYTDEMCLL